MGVDRQFVMLPGAITMARSATGTATMPKLPIGLPSPLGSVCWMIPLPEAPLVLQRPLPRRTGRTAQDFSSHPLQLAELLSPSDPAGLFIAPKRARQERSER